MKRALIVLVLVLTALCLVVGCNKEPKAKAQFVVTFDYNGGTFNNASKDTETVGAGETVSEPVFSPSKKYYKFAGWTKKDSSTLFDFENEKITSNITLYAKYEALYTVGGKGPNGGYIIYENPNYDEKSTTNNWKYLEVAEKDFDVNSASSGSASSGSVTTTTKFAWGSSGTVESATTVGSGSKNTENMSKQGSSVAKEVWGKTYTGGTTDWFIPSKEELELVYKVLKAKGISLQGTYWSSSAVDTDKAYAVAFDATSATVGSATAKDRTDQYKVRLVRAF